MKFQRKTKIILICVCTLCLIMICLVPLGVLPFIMFPIAIFVTFMELFYISYRWLIWRNGLNK